MGVISFLQRIASRRIGVEHRQFRALTGTVLGGERARCPHCRRGRLQIDPEVNDVRICDGPACVARVPLAALAEVFAVADAQAAEVATRERRSAVLFLAGAEMLLIFCAAWAIWTRSWATLLGGALLSIVVGAMALVARYRAWQIENGRMFERQAPVGAYLRWEVTGLLGRR